MVDIIPFRFCLFRHRLFLRLACPRIGPVRAAEEGTRLLPSGEPISTHAGVGTRNRSRASDGTATRILPGSGAACCSDASVGGVVEKGTASRTRRGEDGLKKIPKTGPRHGVSFAALPPCCLIIMGGRLHCMCGEYFCSRATGSVDQVRRTCAALTYCNLACDNLGSEGDRELENRRKSAALR